MKHAVIPMVLAVALVGYVSFSFARAHQDPEPLRGAALKTLPTLTKSVFGDPSDWTGTHTGRIATLALRYESAPELGYSGMTSEVVHPSVVAFEEPWNGHLYWMAITPYVNGDARTENPSILVSDNVVDWYEPKGIQNPVAPFPRSSPGITYSSQGDVQLFYDGQSDMLIITFLRTYDDHAYDGVVSGENTCQFLSIESKDGLTWSDPVPRLSGRRAESSVDLENDRLVGAFGSPCLVAIPGASNAPRYRLYYTRCLAPSANWELCFREADTPFGRAGSWDTVPETVTRQTGIGQGYGHWDFQLYRLADGTFLDCASVFKGRVSTNTELYFGISMDGVNFTYGAPVLRRNAAGTWPDSNVYTTALIPWDKRGIPGFMAIVSGFSAIGGWGIEVTEIRKRTEESLRVAAASRVLYRVVRVDPVSGGSWPPGDVRWGFSERRLIADVWDYPLAFGSDLGVFYAVSPLSELLWFRDSGYGKEGVRLDGPIVIARNWNFKRTFAAPGGLIYAVTDSDELVYFMHNGYLNASAKESGLSGPVKLADKWRYAQCLAAPGGIIYAIGDDGILQWYSHAKSLDGTDSLRGPIPLDDGWLGMQVFAASGGVIYAVTDRGGLLWYRHAGYASGVQEIFGPVTIDPDWPYLHTFVMFDSSDGASHLYASY